MAWTGILAELIHRTTSDLPPDAEAALRAARAREAEGSRAALLLGALVENTGLARSQGSPLCQDTGTLTFFFDLPRESDTVALEAAAREAVALATRNGWLRRNTIDALSGRSIDTNVAPGAPVCHFEQSDRSDCAVWLLQKGGGSENMSRQFSLPDGDIGAGRDLEGVRKCLLHAVWRTQGFGCAPGVLGVCIGADRAEGYLTAKRQLLRPLTDHAADPALAELERRVLEEANSLGIGPMGMGGKTTLLGVKIAGRTRLPASFFVTVAYLCWACRRRGIRVAPDGSRLLGEIDPMGEEQP
ncbi:MAG: fumarate hydratase [Kiritimatiellae bacterium]|nr:fumarate hydratase [Kiritimatiellia bacterium]